MKDNIRVPEGRILAVGDNYRESIDSRDYGFVSTANILEKLYGNEQFLFAAGLFFCSSNRSIDFGILISYAI